MVKNLATTQKKTLLNHGKDIWMIALYSGNTHGGYQRITRPIQNLHPKIKFTMEHSLKELLFLDILIKNVNGKIITYIYHKPTHSQQYLHFRSNHPKNCINSFLYTLARRIHTVITYKDLKKHPLKKLHATLHQRGYPTTLINKGLELAEKVPQRELKKPKNTTTKNPLHTSQLTTKIIPNYSQK